MAQTEVLTVLTIGHSTHSYESFLALLRRAKVTAIADVRTSPYSRHFAHFNRDTLKSELSQDKIAYSFLGKELGGRPSEQRFYCDGIADYEKMALADDFHKGIERVVEGAKKYRIALMCSEQDPLDCHRCLLVARALGERGVGVRHILSDGQIISQSDIEQKLLEISKRDTDDMFDSREERLAEAYRRRARRVAFSEPKLASDGPVAAE